MVFVTSVSSAESQEVFQVKACDCTQVKGEDGRFIYFFFHAVVSLPALKGGQQKQ